MVRPVYTGRIMQGSSMKSIDKRQLWNTFKISSNTSLFADECFQSNSKLVLFVSQNKSKVFQFCFGPLTLLLWCWFPRHLSSVGFVQVLRLCEHILYPTVKRPLALCIEGLILASKFSSRCIYTHRRIIHLSSSAKTN